MKKLNISSLDLGYTIDTYGMFNGESVIDNDYEDLKDEYNFTQEELDNIDITYDHKQIVIDFATHSVGLLNSNLVEGRYLDHKSIVKKIELEDTKSPQFYNYTTDSYMATWTIDETLLIQYINDNINKFANFIQEEWNEFVNVPIKIDIDYLENDNDKMFIAGLDFYTRSVYTPEEYEDDMYEHESEIYTNNIKYDDVTLKLIEGRRNASTSQIQ